MGFNPELPAGLLPETDVEGMKQFLAGLIVPKLHNYVYIQVSSSEAPILLSSLREVLTLRHRPAVVRGCCSCSFGGISCHNDCWSATVHTERLAIPALLYGESPCF